MVSFAIILLFSAIMGFSIYLSLPMVFKSGTGAGVLKLLNAGAVGILLFLLADIFSNVTPIIYNKSLYGYGSNPLYDLVFLLSFSAGFLILFFTEHRKEGVLTPSQTAFFIAVGIAFQNLTEGLVFGSLGAVLGLTGAAVVILVGFILQNMTEGFPISSPFLGKLEHREWQMMSLLFLGGVPDIIGGAVGFYFNSTIIDVLFDGLAMGTILYVIIPMIRAIFTEKSQYLRRVAYAGIFAGFVVGFLVNLI
jgi:ZIP family zinc transporter